MTHIDRERIILAKTAWSKRYDSLGKDDDPVGNHGYLRTGAGSEAFNFKASPDGRFYGHFHVRGHLNLKRIDIREAGAESRGVTVIWVSRPRTGGLRVVGWYQNATVFGRLQREGGPWSHALYGDGMNREGKPSYTCIAPANESFRVPAEEREQWMLPKSVSRRMGRSDFLYPHIDGHLAPWVTQMEDLIRRMENYRPESIPHPPDREDSETADALYGQGLSPDPRRREFIERTAMAQAMDRFHKEGYAVADVSANHPYDLECVKGNERLQVEVKGTSGDGFRVILTEREFNHMAPAGWVRVLYVLPEITELGGEKVKAGKERIISPFDPKSYDSRPISRFVIIGDE